MEAVGSTCRKRTGIDLSKILGGQTKIFGGQKEIKSDKCMGVSQLLGARARAAPKVYVYDEKCAILKSFGGLYQIKLNIRFLDKCEKNTIYGTNHS